MVQGHTQFDFYYKGIMHCQLKMLRNWWQFLNHLFIGTWKFRIFCTVVLVFIWILCSLEQSIGFVQQIPLNINVKKNLYFKSSSPCTSHFHSRSWFYSLLKPAVTHKSLTCLVHYNQMAIQPHRQTNQHFF